MKKILFALVCISLLFNTVALAGLDGKKAAYIGGSTKDKDFPPSKEAIEGYLNTSDDAKFRLDWSAKGKTGNFSIPYDKIIDIEYGQKAGRRVGAAVATAILLTPIALFLLFSKKRKHYITIGYYHTVSPNFHISFIGIDDNIKIIIRTIFLL